MASNPQVPQGTLNRLRASIVWTSFPELNVSASYLTPEAITLGFDGDITQFLPTLVGVVPSPEPYMMANFVAHLVKSTALANFYKRQWELNALIGEGVIRPDASQLEPFQVTNCSIMGVRELDFSGRSPQMAVSFRGTYYINSSLWNIG